MFWYVLVALGSFLEGEFTLVAAGFAVHHRALDPRIIMIVAGPAAFLGDWLFFEIGRRRGDQILHRWPGPGRRALLFGRFMKRFPILAIFFLRFQIGFRMMSNFSLGTSEISRGKYLVLNFLASVLWSVTIVSFCVWFARVFSAILSELY